jgi:RimJ/RimL family protein N-acetyltransferase
MTIEYNDYKLREPIIEDAKGLIEITNDREAMKYYGTSGAYLKTENEALSEINWMKQQCSKHAGRWIITEKGKNQYIGDIGFHNYDKNHNKNCLLNLFFIKLLKGFRLLIDLLC